MEKYKFKQGDKVKVVNGFYRGKSGKISNVYMCEEIEYMIDYGFLGLNTIFIKEKDLELITNG